MCIGTENCSWETDSNMRCDRIMTQETEDIFFTAAILQSVVEQSKPEDLQLLINLINKLNNPSAATFASKHRGDIIKMRFGIGCKPHTLEDVGKGYRVTKERARQLQKSALKILDDKYGHQLAEFCNRVQCEPIIKSYITTKRTKKKIMDDAS